MIIRRQALPFYILFFFYLWTATIEYGFLLGLHLTSISFSFFILCTPIASYWYLVSGLPGAISKESGLINIFSLWCIFLIINIFSIFLSPEIYNKSLIYRAVYSILTTFPINIFTLGFSAGTLLYHWAISQLKNNFAKFIMHLAGIALSFSVSYFVINQNHNSLVFYLMDMSNSNF
jgi:hypothetical protein